MLVAHNLSVRPPGSTSDPVVRDFALEVRRGEWVAITGPNGGGKSTLLLALAGLLPTAGGTVTLDGRPLAAAGGRRAVGVVLQDLPSQTLQPSVAQEIGFGPRNLGRSEDEIRVAIQRWSARLGLEPYLDRDPRTLSAGYQQLTLLAATLASSPRVLLADEAGAHLDPVARGRVLATLREETAGGLAVIWVTQEREEVAAADRHVVLGAPAVTVGLGCAPRAEGGAGPRIVLGRVIVTAAPAADWGGSTAEPRVLVAEDVRFDIPGNGAVILAGANGSGKTTLLEALAGIRRVPQVTLDWLDSTRPSPILAAQHPEEQVFAETVLEEVLFAAIQRGVDRAEASRRALFHFEALALDGAFSKRRTWSLSLGEKRLLQVVGALIAPASLVLLDEPTSGLDPERRDALEHLVVGRATRGPVIVAGHDPAWLRTHESSLIKLGFELASHSKKTD